MYAYRDFFWRRFWEMDMWGSLFRGWVYEVLVREWGMWDKKGRKVNNVYIYK